MWGQLCQAHLGFSKKTYAACPLDPILAWQKMRRYWLILFYGFQLIYSRSSVRQNWYLVDFMLVMEGSLCYHTLFLGRSCLFPESPSGLLLLSAQWHLTVCTPWTEAHQASLSFTVSQSMLKLVPVESAMPPNRLILSHLPLPRFSLARHRGLSQWVDSSHQVAKVLELQLQH